MVAEPINVTGRNTRILPVDFEYYEPSTLEEALELLNRLGRNAKVLAGGTDLLVKMKTRVIEPGAIINVKKIGGLEYIIEDGDVIRIGALTKLRAIEKSEVVARHLPALWDAVKTMGSVQIRNMATIGGNICNASPAADTAPPLLVHEASVVLMSARGKRVVLLEEFFRGPGLTIMEPDEMLVEVMARKAGDGSSAFKKVTRVSVDLAIASSAVYLSLDGDVIKDIRIALGSVAPRPIRAKETERALSGLRMGSEELRKALGLLEREVSPITDARGTAEYRKYIVKVLTWDTIEIAGGRLRGAI